MSFMRKDIISESVPVYTCPKTDILYAGNCPITRCPANVAKLGKKSGCVHNYLNGKREIGVQELAYVFGDSIKDVKLKVELGERAIKRALVLNSILSESRAKRKHTHCAKCGVIRIAHSVCFRTDQCDHRAKTVNPLISRPPLNIPEINFTKADFFAIMHERAAINAFLKTLDTEEQIIRVRTLLCMTKKEYAEVIDLRTIV